jgi:hypothetical protein
MTNKYYLIVDEIQKGPFSFEELKDFSLNKNDLIWFEDLVDWTPIEKIDELSSLIKKVPPPIKKSAVLPPPINNEVKTIEKESFVPKYKWYVLGVVGLIVLLVIAISTKNKNSHNEQSNTSSKTNISIPDVQEKKELSSNELREQLLKKEQSNPLKYLTVNGSMRENKVKIQHSTMFRSSKWKKDGYILEGYIGNSASIASFKDVKVVVSFISNTGSVIEETGFVVYDYVPSTNGITYKQKIYAPEGFSSYEFSIDDAIY